MNYMKYFILFEIFYFISHAFRVEMLLSQVVLRRISQADSFRPRQLIWGTLAPICGQMVSTTSLKY